MPCMKRSCRTRDDIDAGAVSTSGGIAYAEDGYGRWQRGEGSVGEFDIARERNDIVLKRLAAVFKGAVLNRFGLDLPPIVGPLPTDLPLLTARSREADYVFSLADGSLLHLEFQTKREKGDLARFAEYNLALHLHYDEAPVRTVVLWGPAVRRMAQDYVMGSLTLRPDHVLLGEEDGTGQLEVLAAKVEHGEKLNDEDRLTLALLPLMRQRRPLSDRVVVETIKTVAEALPREERTPTVEALAVLARLLMDEAQIRELLGVLTMTNAMKELNEMIDDALRRGLAEGRVEGRVEGEAKGKAEGELEGYRAGLRVLVRARFGKAPDALEARIARATRTTLDDLYARALTVADADAL